jgi:hypothetical protein
MTDRGTIQARFSAALDALVAQVKDDRSVLAAVLCGSMAHDTVWEKSDIDLVLVTVDDKQIERKSVSLTVDDVNIHAMLFPRTEFRKIVEGSLRNSFAHSFLAKGRLLYTHDPTIADLCDRLRDIGARDTQVRLLAAGISALGPIDKAHKWLVTRGDLDYAALWILYAATPLAQIEVIGRSLLADREVIPQASLLNPPFFKTIYGDLLNRQKTADAVERALRVIDTYMLERAPTTFGPVLEHLQDVGEVRSCREIEDHFTRHFDLSGVTLACEYLSDQGLVGKASAPIRLTKRSNLDVQELAFYYVGR